MISSCRKWRVLGGGCEPRSGNLRQCDISLYKAPLVDVLHGNVPELMGKRGDFLCRRHALFPDAFCRPGNEILFRFVKSRYSKYQVRKQDVVQDFYEE